MGSCVYRKYNICSEAITRVRGRLRHKRRCKFSMFARQVSNNERVLLTQYLRFLVFVAPHYFQLFCPMQCDTGLVCSQRHFSSVPVPGCTGTPDGVVDYCVQRDTNHIKRLDNDGSPYLPLRACEGDCNQHSDVSLLFRSYLLALRGVF